jgi:hypothetical protein
MRDADERAADVGSLRNASVAGRWGIAGLFLVCLWGGAATAADPTPKVRFNRDVRAILSNKCFRCHGPDGAARQGDLRLDRREDALAGKAIVPGDPQASEVFRRVTSDADDVMPPRDSALELSSREKETLRLWIAQGAEYEPHWSLLRPVATPIPAMKGGEKAKNPIDHFVMASLERQGLAPAPPADPATLLRRASLALTGLPPTPQELDVFLADTAPQAYERAVDRLLASTRNGERMAAVWLDAARYADTNGYFGDNPRQIWPWRDWVINAFNRNMPFDQFTIEQIAGDLLPNPTLEQKVATGFNRNHTVTDETGIIDEEYRVEYVADRIETTGTVWLGLTIGCARCHDHKYDPITQREYYRLFAFFNNGPESGLAVAHDQPPTLDLTSPEQQAEIARLTAARTEADAALERVSQSLREPIAAWELKAAGELTIPSEGMTGYVGFEPETDAKGAGAVAATTRGGEPSFEAGIVGKAAVLEGMRHVEVPHAAIPNLDKAWSLGLWIKPTGSLNCVFSKIEPSEARRGVEVLWAKGRLKLNLIHRWGSDSIEVATKDAIAKSGWHHVVVQSDGSQRAAGVKILVDGVAAELKVERDALGGSINNSHPLRVGQRDNGLGYYGHLDELRVYRRMLTDDEVSRWFWSDRLRGILAVAADQRDAKSQTIVRDYFIERFGEEPAKAALREAAQAQAAEDGFRGKLPKTLVMQERTEPRMTHVLLRGQYDHPGEKIEPGFPEALLSGEQAQATDAPQSRLDLARWIASPENPLTARVAVNRLWQIAFGEGLVRTTNDFGSQGDQPTHPELLDWLAVRFVDDGWDVKQMLRRIVTSATFRQSSIPTRSLLAADPDNRWLARGPRFRLPAEMIRDQALFVSGLLVERVGGPSVKPWQPAGLWEAVSYDGDATYVPDRGEGLWRRSLYTYWKRQAPPPSLLIFDAPTRETCAVNRPRTNTPSQALVLLNDPAYVEAARNLAAETLGGMTEGRGAEGDLARLKTAFRRATSRHPTERECDVLVRLLERQRRRFASDPAAAEAFVATSRDAPSRSTTPQRTPSIPELAAWTAVAQTILNLDETVTSR